ncbi:hypothetical protein Droror1_Dr00012147 [Drosera rotundifolia]
MVAESSRWSTLVLAYKTLGVVFGGLVTSPLYVYPSMPLVSPTTEDYLGICSIMLWTLTLIGVVKYASIALRADDQGEGGTFAVYSLLCKNMNLGIRFSESGAAASNVVLYEGTRKQSRLAKFFKRSVIATRVLLFIAMLGMCMMIGDGILTPAISVLSAIEGIRAPFPKFKQSMVEAVSAAILIVIFLLQRFGTSKVSFLFSPIMATWTLTTPLIGIYNIVHFYPAIFKSLSPHYIVTFFLRNGWHGWRLLGSIVLCITGSEALFADLGHFNKQSIQAAFMFAIYPSLALTYVGQTAYLIKHPNDFADGFYKFIPKPVYWPMFIVSTLAAIVASQSLISAAFSVVKQSVVLDYFPRVKVVHTSPKKEGMVYSPEVNYTLMVLCLAIILIFGNGQQIGNAFGVVVCMVMVITTTLLTLVMIIVWRTPAILIALFFMTFFTMESVYVSAVLTKLPQGGWIPFVISLILVFIMFGWYYGRQKKLEFELMNKVDTSKLGDLLSDPSVHRVPGICFFYTSIQDGITPFLGHYIRNTKSLQEITIFTTLQYLMVPKVELQDRLHITKLSAPGTYRCMIQYGYADNLDLKGDEFVKQVTAGLQNCLGEQDLEDQKWGQDVDITDIVHVRGKTRFYVGKNAGWFDRYVLPFYEAMHKNCTSGLPELGIPMSQLIEVGMLYEV